MRDLPGPGLKPVSPALAGGFLTTAPPGKHSLHFRRITTEAAPGWTGGQSQESGRQGGALGMEVEWGELLNDGGGGCGKGRGKDDPWVSG